MIGWMPAARHISKANRLTPPVPGSVVSHYPLSWSGSEVGNGGHEPCRRALRGFAAFRPSSALQAVTPAHAMVDPWDLIPC